MIQPASIPISAQQTPASTQQPTRSRPEDLEKARDFEAAAEAKPLLHTWRLAVEEQFYTIFPVAVLLLYKRLDLRTLSKKRGAGPRHACKIT